MSDFPRGWTLSTHVNGAGAASITVAAVTGVVHVLDSFGVKIANGSGTLAYLSTVALSSSDGLFAGFILGSVAGGVATAGGEEVDTASGSGLDLAAGPGASLTVSLSAGFAGLDVTLILQGHDI